MLCLLLTGYIAYFWVLAVELAMCASNPLTSIHGVTTSDSIRGLYFMGVLFCVGQMLSLPFSIYKTFIIEQKYGFNKMTAGLFIRDTLLSVLLQSVFGGVILYLLLEVIAWGGSVFVYYVTLFLMGVILVMSTIYPNLIQPLFNKFEELEDGSLKQRIHAKSDQLHFPLTKIYVCDASKRSAHSNAYLYGFWWNKRIVLFDTLFKQCNED